jgi:hypothetical protein
MFQCSWALSKVPRSPPLMVCTITGLSGGSPVKSFGSEHGAAGSAHSNSIGVGVRMPSS